MQKEITVRGEISCIKYRNSEGWGIFYIKGSDGPLTGVLAEMCDVGSVVSCTGVEQNSKYGPQIKCSAIVPEVPDTNTEEGVARLLMKLPGIGHKKAADAIANHGAAGAWSLACSSPEMIGVPASMAEAAKTLAQGLIGSYEQQVYLLSIGLTDFQASKISAKYGSESKNVVSTNPYQLIKDLPGVGFLTADKIAFKAGIKAGNPSRISACILYVLEDGVLSQGHIWWPGWELCKVVTQALTDSAMKAQIPIVETPDEQTIRQAIYGLAQEGLVTIEGGRVFSNKFLEAEKSILTFISGGGQ